MVHVTSTQPAHASGDEKKMEVLDPRALRRRLGLNQAEFWRRVGVTQSGGSRYENDRRIPKSVQQLLRAIYVAKVDLAKITRADADVLAYVKSAEPALYRRLRAAAKKAA
jgi:transcriptional regulator with XRE-family HTH domain